MSAQQRVISQPGSGLIGDSLTLTGAIQQVANFRSFLLNVTLQAATTNAGVVWIYDSGGHRRIGFIQAGGSFSVDIDSITKIYVEGTSNDVIYWIGLQS